MDIDDEFQEYMRLAHPDLPESSPQWAITRNAFFAGMTAMHGVLFGGLSPKKQVRVFMQVRAQLLRHANRAVQGMEQGFTNTDLRT